MNGMEEIKKFTGIAFLERDTEGFHIGTTDLVSIGLSTMGGMNDTKE